MQHAQVIKRQPIGIRVKELLIGRILNGTYPPGFRLVEPRIARELGISLAPLREALGSLEAAGLVESEPYRGTRVREPSEQEILEALQVRGALEELSAILATPTLRSQGRSLRTQNAAIVEAGKAGDSKRSAHLHLVFHRTIVEAAGNSVLLRMWNSLTLEAGFPLQVWQSRFDYQRMAGEHGPIIEALEQGSGKRAGKLLRVHCEALAQNLSTPARRTNVGKSRGVSISRRSRAGGSLAPGR